MKKHFILITSQSHAELGLFQDLKSLPDVEIVIPQQKKVSPLLSRVRRIHTSWTINRHVPLPLRKKWYQPLKIKLKPKCENIIIVIDIALKGIECDYLNFLFSQKHTKGILIMINSYHASSVGMMEIKKDIPAVRWDRILTFDPVDAKRNGWEYLGCCYYSLQSPEEIIRTYGKISPCDAYFTGGIKGSRENLIMSIFEKLYHHGIKTKFNLMISGTKRLEKRKYEDVICYLSGVWIPYQKVLHEVLGANVIIEILQKGQHGPSLRYYEAVCYNKKLITNNPLAVKLPFYNPEYIRIIKTADDIDLDWVLSPVPVDYGYQGEFSPVHLINMLR